MQVYFDGCSHVIAETPEDATAFLADHTGDDDTSPSWEVVPSGALITIACDYDGVICSVDDDHEEVTLSAANWIERAGPGFLCSDSS